jgi:hypothetical protein
MFVPGPTLHIPALQASTVGQLVALIEERLADIARQASEERTRVLIRYESYQNYYDKLRYIAVDGPGEFFDRAYDLYTEIFDPGHTFPKDVILDQILNCKKPDVVARYGNLTQHWMVAEDPVTNQHLGMISYYITPIPADVSPDYDAAVYTAITQIRPKSRMPQFFDRLVTATQNDIAAHLVKSGTIKAGQKPRLLLLTNYLHPLMLTPRDYLLDHFASGINTFERIGWFNMLKYKQVLFDYERPPSTPEMAPIPGYIYAARPAHSEQVIQAPLFTYAHERYCAMRQRSFNVETDRFQQQFKKTVNAMGQVPLVDRSQFYVTRLRRKIYEWLDTNQKTSLLDSTTSNDTFGKILNMQLDTTP